MYIANVRRLSFCVALIAGFAQTVLAADILIADAKSQPESLTVAPGGVLIVGSASTPFVYKVRPGASTAEKFVDASAEGPGTFFFGMLADAVYQHVVDLSIDPGARHNAGAAAHRTERLRPLHWRSQDPLEPAGRQQHLQRFRDRTGQGALHHRHRQQQNLQAAGRRFHRRTVPGASRALWHRRHHLFERHALCEQRLFEQSLPHPSRRRGQGRDSPSISGWISQ